MGKHILEFTKNEEVKYVSHLDIIRMFGRAMRRAGLDISFSQGFNPHPVMNFAHPMGVGISSECELIKIGVEGDISAGEFLNRLSPCMPRGFELKNAEATESKTPFSELFGAKYVIDLSGKVSGIEKLMEMPEIITEKKTKSGVKETDIRPLILGVKILSEEENHTVVEAHIRCGEPNLKPELFIKVLKDLALAKPESYKIHRKALLNAEGKPLIKFKACGEGLPLA